MKKVEMRKLEGKIVSIDQVNNIIKLVDGNEN